MLPCSSSTARLRSVRKIVTLMHYTFGQWKHCSYAFRYFTGRQYNLLSCPSACPMHPAVLPLSKRRKPGSPNIHYRLPERLWFQDP